ncbi:hypothetical protein DJ568_01165 [Mucilaginibacter hurinus]|uniref:DUF4783 domain-containing protein n=1 Tax=Mucilaginibacter hurinus TaxID=2201324 RepID=A0A367GTI4_9SPHI|nr:DUF4783 domain-containing protein [Mucilaginibacter hurinus]RCH56498.1 hypothetical protein DJ568_01165 [Mucilaginibacter hurinus]
MTKTYSIFLLLTFYLIPLAVNADPIGEIAELIKAGKHSELEKHFAPSVDITILKDENIFSNTQAAIVVSKFFTQNKLRNVKILHKVNTSNTYRFGVLLISTDRGTYRLSFTLNSINNGALQIIDLRIEAEKGG